MKSMTGFGRGNYENDARQYIVEIKSVNNRYSDINIKLPRSLSYIEEPIKKRIAKCITRGKIDVFVTFNNNSDKGKNIEINADIAKKYIEELKKLSSKENIIDNINIMDISRLPEVLNMSVDKEAEEIIQNELLTTLDIALNNFVEMRIKEADKIKIDLEKRIKLISNNIDKISKISAGLVDEYIVKLETRIKEILKTNIVDENRLAQEIVIYSDKCSVEEEITRLNSHISQFSNLINQNGPIGKKIDFLIQEMNRETNTIGSKANNLQITNLVVDTKTEIENIREQIQNIE